MLYINTIQSLKSYAKKYPEEDIKDLLTIAQLNEKITKRENVHGHVTASGLVLCDGKLLLIFHKKLQKYLQPGGHLENDQNLVEAARREVLEETGIHTIPYRSEEKDLVTPLHIDIHTIPHNEKKGEQEHLHYDCMFLLFAKDSGATIQKSEIDGYKWVELNFPFQDKGLIDAIQKIKRLHHDVSLAS